MNNHIIYNVESVQILEEENKNIMMVSGWVKTANNIEVNIELNKNIDWMLRRFWRDDICGNPENRCGFQIFIWLKKNKRNIKIIFSSSAQKKKVIIPFALIPILKFIKKNKERGQENVTGPRVDKLPFMNFVVTDELRYCIDAIYYNVETKRVSISGWVYALNDNKTISVNGNRDFVWEKRRDVKEALEMVLKISEKCGFRGGVEFFSKEKFCHICIDAERDGRVEVNYTIKTLEEFTSFQYSEVIKQKKFLVKRKDSGYEREMKCKYGEKGAFYKAREVKIWNHENDLNNLKYQWKEIEVSGTRTTYKNEPLLSVLCAIKLNEENESYIKNMFLSIRQQNYKHYETVLCGSQSHKKWINKNFPEAKYILCESEQWEDCLLEALKHSKGKWICFVEQEDILSPYYLSTLVENINKHRFARVIFQDYDIWYDESPQIKVCRTEKFVWDESQEMVLTALCVYKKSVTSIEQLTQSIKKASHFQIVHDRRVGYHYNAVKTPWEKKGTKIIAFYLPQFHITEENNRWWGKGFTEWTNVKRAMPMFEGHDQPRIPADLGYYDLVEDRSAQYKQVDLAKRFGIYGFCYYYYWFEGKKLLHKPLNQFVGDKNLDFPFCICWANETWSKRWNGQENEILIKQEHNAETDTAFIKEMIPLFKDSRYIKINGRPLLLIYRINLFPEPYKTIQTWKKMCIESDVGEIHVSIVQSFGIVDHRAYGADSSVEFPPHKIMGKLADDSKLSIKKEFSGSIFSYREIVENLSVIRKRDYIMFPGSMLKWDNTARRMEKSDIFAEFEPELYRKWLIRNHYYSKLYNDSDIIFVNAWNEWAEGTYLEPDITYGTTFLEISKAVSEYK